MIRIYSLPPQLLNSPYLDQLYGAMTNADVTVRRIRPRYAVPEMLRTRGPRILHIHFFDELTQRHSQLQTAGRSLGFLALLEALRRMGVGIVWTAHNLEPHELYHPQWGFTVYRWVARHSNAVIAHSSAARDALESYYGPLAHCAIIPHGSYIGLYGPMRDRVQSRTALGLPTEGCVFLNLGTLRPYKGLEDFVAAFAALPETARGTLLIAGATKDPAYAASLQHQMHTIPGAHFHQRFVPDSQVPTYLAAADVVVLPYHSLLSSGMLLWALSYGRPVVAPAFGPVREIVQEGVQGFLFTPGDQASLEAALGRALAHPDLQVLGQAALKVAHRFDWPSIARQTVEVYYHVAG